MDSKNQAITKSIEQVDLNKKSFEAKYRELRAQYKSLNEQLEKVHLVEHLVQSLKFPKDIKDKFGIATDLIKKSNNKEVKSVQFCGVEKQRMEREQKSKGNKINDNFKKDLLVEVEKRKKRNSKKNYVLINM
jgi:hypothetical protein